MKLEIMDWAPQVGDRVKLVVQQDWIGPMGHKDGMVGTVVSLEGDMRWIAWDDPSVYSLGTYWGRWPLSLIRYLIRPLEEPIDWSELELM